RFDFAFIETANSGTRPTTDSSFRFPSPTPALVFSRRRMARSNLCVGSVNNWPNVLTGRRSGKPKRRISLLMPTPDPWLNIPLDDYEAHMNAHAVGQLRVLSELFAEALASCRPESLAILGIAGGNGLEHVDPSVTRRVVGIDINPDYLDTLRQRHGARLNLELHCCDLAQQSLMAEPVQLVHAALIFEHAGAGRCLENA